MTLKQQRSTTQHAGCSNNCRSSDIWPTIFALTTMSFDCTNLSLNPSTVLFTLPRHRHDECVREEAQARTTSATETAHRVVDSYPKPFTLNRRAPLVSSFRNTRQSRRFLSSNRSSLSYKFYSQSFVRNFRISDKVLNKISIETLHRCRSCIVNVFRDINFQLRLWYAIAFRTNAIFVSFRFERLQTSGSSYESQVAAELQFDRSFRLPAVYLQCKYDSCSEVTIPASTYASTNVRVCRRYHRATTRDRDPIDAVTLLTRFLRIGYRRER